MSSQPSPDPPSRSWLPLFLPAWSSPDMTDDEFATRYGPGLRGAGFDSVVWTTSWNEPPTRTIHLTLEP